MDLGFLSTKCFGTVLRQHEFILKSLLNMKNCLVLKSLDCRWIYNPVVPSSKPLVGSKFSAAFWIIGVSGNIVIKSKQSPRSSAVTLRQLNLIHKKGSNGWVFSYELSGCRFKSSCSHLNFRFCTCFKQGVPWHSGNYRVWIHSETCTWHDKNTQP